LAGIRVGIDTGGTFTDVVAIDSDTGEMVSSKTPSSPGDPSQALAAALDKIRQVLGRPSQNLEAIIHGTTVATNALLEERIDSVALITTAGFRHILEIARQSVPSGYGNSYFWVKPDRIIPLERVFEVDERLNFRGEVLRPLDEEGVRAVARGMQRRGIRAAAVSLIHAYADSAHERRVKELLLEHIPDLAVSLSSEVLPEYREYERTMTTCIDAYVKPVMQGYIGKAAEQLPRSTPFLIMQSNGGVLSGPEVARRPISTLLSGPAAGALGAGFVAGLAGYSKILTVDAGGTSTDICLVEEGKPHISTSGSVGRFPIRLPMVDITTIGTGGGSIAWRDASGRIRVGPRSAGAIPGPMCYGHGGDQPTLTDANLVLGRLPAQLLGGEMPLAVGTAQEGLQRLAADFDLPLRALCHGILEIANWNQVNAIRQLTVKKGLDPREYVLVAFGGSGPLQAARVAELLGIKTVLIPWAPGNVSALGLLCVDLKTDHVLTNVCREDEIDLPAINREFERLSGEANRGLEAEGIPVERRRLTRSLDVRYFGEAYEVRIPAPTGEIDHLGVREITEAFHREHERLYGYSYKAEQKCELVNLRVEAIGLVDRPSLRAAISESGSTATASVQIPGIDSEDSLSMTILSRGQMAPGYQLAGPAIVAEYGSTTVVPTGWTGRVDSWRNMILRPSGAVQ